MKDMILKRSGSYNHYKNEYEKLLEENRILKDRIKELEKQNDDDSKDKEIEEKLDFLTRKVKGLSKKVRFKEKYDFRINNELKYAFVFNDTIRDSEWLCDSKFSLVNSAANYSFAYMLYRILDESRPKNILEFGLGQTSKITSQYANFFDDVKLSIIEGDEVWIEKFSQNMNLTDNICIHHCDLEQFDFKGTENLRFKDIPNVVGDDKFDLIIIDGPLGYIPTDDGDVFMEYPRSNVFDLIENNLNDDFIIVMDDCHREGELRTMNHVEELLTDKNIEYYSCSSVGLKEQYLLVSEKYVYITWF